MYNQRRTNIIGEENHSKHLIELYNRSFNFYHLGLPILSYVEHSCEPMQITNLFLADFWQPKLKLGLQYSRCIYWHLNWSIFDRIVLHVGLEYTRSLSNAVRSQTNLLCLVTYI